jgi:hypothetical protein
MCGKLGPPLMTSTQRSTKNSTSLCTTPTSARVGPQPRSPCRPHLSTRRMKVNASSI